MYMCVCVGTSYNNNAICNTYYVTIICYMLTARLRPEPHEVEHVAELAAQGLANAV